MVFPILTQPGNIIALTFADNVSNAFPNLGLTLCRVLVWVIPICLAICMQ
jgi:hypothetical protein